MQVNWKYTESTVRPLEVDIVSSPTSIYLAKNIVEKQRDDMNGELTTYFEYQSAILSHVEYLAYIAEKERSDIDYIAMMTDVDLEEA